MGSRRVERGGGGTLCHKNSNHMGERRAAKNGEGRGKKLSLSLGANGPSAVPFLVISRESSSTGVERRRGGTGCEVGRKEKSL